MRAASGPQHLSGVLSELIALRGFAREAAGQQLADVWAEVSGSGIADETRVLGLKRGTLQIGVSNAALLSELVAFHKTSLLEALKENHADLNVRDLKFLLKGNLSPS